MIEYENLAKSNKSFQEEYKQALDIVLEKGWYILGKNVSDFETAFAHYCGTSRCVGVGSGLDALLLALQVCNFSPQSEVIIPANTFVATIWAVLHCGLTPVLVEPDLSTYTVDPEKVKEAITSKTKAIIPVHLYGKMCAMDPIMQIARENELIVLEDAAQAHGAAYFGKKAGSIGHFGAFSFYPVKNLGALGDGGAITLNDEAICHQLQKWRNYGATEKYRYETIGYNSRLDELQAAFLLIKLKRLEEIHAHKRKLAAIYFDRLKQDFILPIQAEGYQDVFHIFAVRHPKRDNLREYLRKKEIGTEIHYPIPPHQQKALVDHLGNMAFPISQEIHDTVVSLPIAFHHTEKEIQYVCDVLNEF